MDIIKRDATFSINCCIPFALHYIYRHILQKLQCAFQIFSKNDIFCLISLYYKNCAICNAAEVIIVIFYNYSESCSSNFAHTQIRMLRYILSLSSCSIHRYRLVISKEEWLQISMITIGSAPCFHARQPKVLRREWQLTFSCISTDSAAFRIIRYT